MKLISFALLCGCAIWAQTPAPAPAAAATPAARSDAPPAKDPWAVGKVKFGFVFDGYLSGNTNKPLFKRNFGRAFDVRSGAPDLNLALMSVEMAPEPVGFRVDLGVGTTIKSFYASSPAEKRTGDGLANLLQAYVSLKPKKDHGFQLDFGKFYTAAGAEVTESHLNWNYSRAYLYNNGPFYHFGVRANAPIGKHFNVGAQLVNGWNNEKDNNSAKTVGLTSSIVFDKITWANVYYTGAENFDTSKGKRNFWDTVLLINPNPKANFYINVDIGANGRPDGSGSDKFGGVGFAGRFVLHEKFNLSPRWEYYKDASGFISGTAQNLKEFTLTGDYKVAPGWFIRPEFRRDWSDKGFFDGGTGFGTAKAQNTFSIGIIASFGARRPI